VTSLNHHEDLSPLVRAMYPDRWKVFQVLPIIGQNDGIVEELLITTEQFAPTSIATPILPPRDSARSPRTTST
jgi:hypothetical protein